MVFLLLLLLSLLLLFFMKIALIINSIKGIKKYYTLELSGFNVSFSRGLLSNRLIIISKFETHISN